MESKSNIKVEAKYVMKCPSCNNESLEVTEFIYDFPLVGKSLVVLTRCRVCGYKHFETVNLESRQPTKLIFRVESSEDLNSIVVKSKAATIKIPELNVEIEPAAFSEAYITTVEGILYRVLEVLETCDTSNKECVEAKSKVYRAIRGEVKFTVIVEDPEGISNIIAKDRRKLTVRRL